MTLEEAIKNEEKTSNNYYSLMDAYHTDLGVYLKEETRARNNAEYHEQLAELLKELKNWREGKIVRMANDNTETLIFK